MRILLLTTNPNTFPLYEWLVQRERKTFLYSEKLTPDLVKELKADFLISYNYKYIIPEEVLKLFPPCRRINLHISYLPWNKGSFPNLWSFLEDTPKGVTIHVLEPELDGGDILLQKEVFIDEEVHTLESSYNLLHKEIQELFKRHWEDIKNCAIPPKPQKGKGSKHTLKDFKKIKHLLEPEGWRILIKVLKERYRNWSGNKGTLRG
jgi:methionyl-tRNA formyltransferase